MERRGRRARRADGIEETRELIDLTGERMTGGTQSVLSTRLFFNNHLQYKTIVNGFRFSNRVQCAKINNTTTLSTKFYRVTIFNDLCNILKTCNILYYYLLKFIKYI